MTPAEELRKAAESLRDRSSKAQRTDADLAVLSNWFNSLGPEIGEPLATLLESLADAGPESRITSDDFRAAVEIARTVNTVVEWPPRENA